MSNDDQFFNLQSPHRVEFTYPIQPDDYNKSEINLDNNSKQSFNVANQPLQRKKNTTFNYSKYQSKFVESLYSNSTFDEKAKNYQYLFDPDSKNQTQKCKSGLHSISLNVAIVFINTFIILYLPIQIVLNLVNFIYLFQIFIVIEIILDWIQFKALNNQLSIKESIIYLIVLNKYTFIFKILQFLLLLIQIFLEEQISQIFLLLPLLIIYLKQICEKKIILQYQIQLFDSISSFINFIHSSIIILNYLTSIYYLIILEQTTNYANAWSQIIQLFTNNWQSILDLQPFQEIVLIFIQLTILIIWIILVSLVFNYHQSLEKYQDLKKMISKIPNTSVKKSQLIQIVESKSKLSKFLIKRIEGEVNIEIKISILKQCFTYLSDKTISNIAPQIEFIQYIDEPVSTKQHSLYYILEGEVLITTSNGKKLNTIKKCNYFGEISFYTQQKGNTISIANEECLLLKIDRQIFLNNLNEIEKQIFHQKKDQILFSQKRFGKCYCCKKNGHYIISCPLIQYQPNILQLIQQSNLQINERQKYYRIRKSKSGNARYMQSYYGTVEQDYDLKNDAISLEYIITDDMLKNQSSSKYMLIDSNLSDIQQNTQTQKNTEYIIPSVLEDEIVIKSGRYSPQQKQRLNTIKEISQDLEEGEQDDQNKNQNYFFKTNVHKSLNNLNTNSQQANKKTFRSEEMLKQKVQKFKSENQLFGESTNKFVDLECQINEMDYFDKMYEFDTYFVNYNYPRIIEKINQQNKSSFITYYKNNITLFMQKVYSSTS